MDYHAMQRARIAKPSARLTPEEDAERFVLAWERRMIRNGRAWRDPKTKEFHFDPRPHYWAIKLTSWGQEDGTKVHLIRVPQSVLVLRLEGCICNTVHVNPCSRHPLSDWGRHVKVENGGVA